MKDSLTVNSVDLSGYIVAIEHYPVYRQSRAVVTLDGTKAIKQVEKAGLRVKFRTVTDTEMAAIQAAVTAVSTVSFVSAGGTARTGVSFLASAPTFTSGTSRGTRTYYTGGTLEMEEQ